MIGGELFDKIVQKKFYNENEARSVVKTLVEAVGYCHSLNIAHRDLKLANIMFTDKSPDADLKLIDFGLSKVSFLYHKILFSLLVDPNICIV